MAGILVFCENDDTTVELLSKGKELKSALGGQVGALVLGVAPEEKAKQLLAYGADTLYVARGDVFASINADIYSDAIAQAANNYGLDTVLVGSTRAGKEIAGMVAQRLGAGCVTDAIDIKLKDGALLVDRYCLGGATIASLTVKTPKQVISVMPRTFEASAKGLEQSQVVAFSPTLQPPKQNVVEKQEKKGESTPIEAAETLVCIGRGINDKKDLPMIEELAKAMQGEIGCTRPLTHDIQWYPESREVGLSGKKCKPALCLSIGISGQIQHTVGIRNAKIIAAINKDKNAPIFKTADYGIVADLYDVVPKLTQKIQAMGSK